MTRVKRGVVTRARHSRLLAKAKGYRWKRSNVFRFAKNAVMKAGMHAYVGRKQKKRDYRALWITRVSASVKIRGARYSDFISGLTKKNVVLNRKMLSELSIQHPSMFDQLLALAQK